jgi:hypothetical protein
VGNSTTDLKSQSKHRCVKNIACAGCWWLMTNPSYSGGRDQEDRSLKPAWANSSGDPISKTLSTKRVGGVAQGVSLEFKPQYCKRKEKNKYCMTLGTSGSCLKS